MIATLLVLVSLVRGSTPLHEQADTVDLIELNNYHDASGQHAYTQIIFYEWAPDYSRFHVIAWRLVEGDASQMPHKEGEWYVARWRARGLKDSRIVRSKLFRETWTTVDPERENGKLFDEKYRRSLHKIELEN